MSWVVSVAYPGGELFPLFKAKSQARAVELFEQFREQHPVERFALTFSAGVSDESDGADATASQSGQRGLAGA